jgi:hypothetical protein
LSNLVLIFISKGFNAILYTADKIINRNGRGRDGEEGDLDPDVWRKVDALAALKDDNADRLTRSR